MQATIGRNHVTSPSSARAENQLLASLPHGAWQQLEPDLQRLDLLPGTLLYEAGAELSHVYFPGTAVVSLVSLMQDGTCAEVAMVGNEGIVGTCAFMGGGRAHSSAVVQAAGHGWRMRAPVIAGHARRSEAVMQQLLRYANALFTHMAQTSACNRLHGLDQQLCRWLLLNLDRRKGNELRVTQERIAGMLGVRREGVTSSALKLQKAGLIHYVRGHIYVLDRAGLEQRSCECYSVIKQAYDRLLPRGPDPRPEVGWERYRAHHDGALLHAAA
jgi:CRP-like cAMP-binding protein